MTRLHQSATILLFLLLVLAGCKKHRLSNPRPLPNAGTIKITGIVVNEQDQPLSGVSIRSGSQSAVSGGDGKFSIANAAASNGRVVVEAEKTGYFASTLATMPPEGKTATFRIVMTERKIVASFDASAGGTGSIGGGTVKIPANGVVTKDGSSFSGTVQMAARYIDPESPALASLMPGGDFLALNQNGQETSLYTYGAVEVELQSAAGQPLQLKAGSQATLSLPVAASQSAQAPASLPLWYFDTGKNKWVEEGTATRQGNRYVGNVKHFTAWNLDVPSQVATVQGHIKNCEGKGIAYISVNIEQLSTHTDEEGFYSMRIPANTALKAVVTIPEQTGTRKDSFNIPPVPAQTTLTVDHQTKCPVTIKGQVVTQQNVPVKATVRIIASDGLRTLTTDDQGRFSAVVASNASITVEASANGQAAPPANITTPASGVMDIGKLQLQPITSNGSGVVTFTVNGAGFTNKVFTISNPSGDTDNEGIYETSANYTRLLKFENETLFQTDFPGRELGARSDFRMFMRLPGHKAMGLSDNGRLTITKYEALGGLITGQFFGTFMAFDELTNQPLGQVTVTNGSFTLHHTDDLP